MRKYLKYILYLYVFIGISASHAGSYEDFFSAIQRDDTATVESLLKRGFDPNTPNPQGQFGLVLLDWPQTRIDTRNAADESALMMAALRGHADLARRLIGRGADVNKPGWAPLHYAATGGHVALISMLLEAHAYIDAESPTGTTPLMMAAQYGSGAAVRLLLESGADASLKNQLGLNAQDFAMRVGRQDVFELIGSHMRKQRPPASW